MGKPITPRFDVGETVYYLKDNRIVKSEVLRVKTYSDLNSVSIQYEVKSPSKQIHSSCENLNQEDVFASIDGALNRMKATIVEA